jgi:glycosyltransferase involved in cell wall biosynthesis
MRIAYLCLEPQQSRSHISGYAVHLNAMIGAFQRAGHAVNVIVLGEWLGRKQVVTPPSARKGLSFKRLAKRAIPSLLWETAKDLRVMSYDRRFRGRYRGAILSFRPDVIYEQTAFLAAAGRRVAEEAGIPRMAELHAPMVEERCRDGRKSLLAGHATRVETRNLMSARRIRTVSSPLKAHLVARGIPPERILVQPNGVDLNKFRPSSGDGARVRRQWHLENKTVFGFAGSFFRWHGIDSLLRGFARARSECPDAALLIVGDGEDGKELRQLAGALEIAASVAFTGNVPFAAMADYYAAMDVCCLTGGNWYQSPLKLLDYGAMRKPIIAPDTTAVRDVMTPERDCIMIKPGSVEEVAGAIQRLYARPALREEIAARFHEKVVRTCSWDAVAGNILAHLEAVARRE